MTANVKPKTAVKLRARAECPSHSLANVAIRDLNFAIDEPLERGGSNRGPAPTDAALAALIGCTNVIGNKCASRLGLELGRLSVEAVCEFDRRGVALQEEIDVPFARIRLTVRASRPVAQADLDELSAQVRKYCPLSKLFRQAGTEITEEWTSEPG